MHYRYYYFFLQITPPKNAYKQNAPSRLSGYDVPNNSRRLTPSQGHVKAGKVTTWTKQVKLHSIRDHELIAITIFPDSASRVNRELGDKVNYPK